MNEKNVWVVLHGLELNHDNEEYRLYSTSIIDRAHSIIDNVGNCCKESKAECAFGWEKINTTSQFIYVIWLNELSRIYAGMEIMSVVDNIKQARQDFHDFWQHQSYRWGFDTEYNDGERKEPSIDLSNSNIKMYWRNNGGDCEQTLGIARLKADDYSMIHY